MLVAQMLDTNVPMTWGIAAALVVIGWWLRNQGIPKGLVDKFGGKVNPNVVVQPLVEQQSYIPPPGTPAANLTQVFAQADASLQAQRDQLAKQLADTQTAVNNLMGSVTAPKK